MQEAGHEIQALINRPQLTIWTKDLYEAFYLLTDSRPVHFGGLGSIPMTEIEAYMRIDGIKDLESRYRFMTAIKAMDAEYLKLQKERKEREDKLSKQRQQSQVGGSNLPPRRGRLPRSR